MCIRDSTITTQYGDEILLVNVDARLIMQDVYKRQAKEGVLRPVTPAQQAAADLARIKAETLPIPTGIQTALAEHYQACLLYTSRCV